MARKKCRYCGGTGWEETKAVRRVWEEDLRQVLALLVTEGKRRACDDVRDCQGHLERSEVITLTRWNGTKIKLVGEALTLRGCIHITKNRPNGGRGAPLHVWHKISDMD